MRFTQDKAREVITDWQNSGLSKKAFCRQRNMRYQTFHYWYNRLHNTSSSPGFTEIKVTAVVPKNFQVIFPTGVRIVFECEPSVNWLRELLR